MTIDDDNTSEDVAIRMAKEAAVVLSEKELAEFVGVLRTPGPRSSNSWLAARLSL